MYNAATYCSDSKTYWFFKGNQCYSKKFGEYDVKPGGSIASQFPGANIDNMDAACYCSSSSTYWFFKGDQCYSKAYGNHEVVAKGSIASQFPGTNIDNMDAACYCNDTQTYWFFKGDQCYSKAYGNHDIQYKGEIYKNFSGGNSQVINGYMKVNFLSLALSTKSPFYPESHAKTINPKVINYITNNTEKIQQYPSGIIIADFPSYDLVSTIINLNKT